MSILLNNPPKNKQKVKNGLVLYLDSRDFLNSPSTVLLKDKSGNGNDATPTNFSYINTSGSDENGGIIFDGINDIETINHSSSINFNGDFTLEIVIKGINSGLSETILSKANMSGGTVGYGFILRSTAPYIKFFIFDVAVKGTTICNTDIRDGKKHIIQAKKTGGNFKLFIDGILISNDSLTVGSFTNTEPLRIGENYNGGTPNNFLKSTIYMIAMYNRALTDSELNQNYKASK